MLLGAWEALALGSRFAPYPTSPVLPRPTLEPDALLGEKSIGDSSGAVDLSSGLSNTFADALLSGDSAENDMLFRSGSLSGMRIPFFTLNSSPRHVILLEKKLATHTRSVAASRRGANHHLRRTTGSSRPQTPTVR